MRDYLAAGLADLPIQRLPAQILLLLPGLLSTRDHPISDNDDGLRRPSNVYVDTLRHSRRFQRRSQYLALFLVR